MFQNYPAYEYALAQIQLVLFMLAMGATLHPRDFLPILQRPRDLIFGLSMILLIVPLLTVGAVGLLGLSEGIAYGLILVAALPGGTLSNVLTYFSRGNVPLSIALSAIGTLVSMATIPLILVFLASTHVLGDLEMPVGQTIRDIFCFLLLPLVVGMAVGRRWPDVRKPFCKICLALGLTFVLVMVVGSLGSGRIRLYEYTLGDGLVVVLFCLAWQQLTMLPYRLGRASPTISVALGNEVAVRNINLGLLLTASLFPAGSTNRQFGDDVLFVVLFYGAAMFFIAIPLTLRIRRKLGKSIGSQLTAASQSATIVNSPHPDDIAVS